jgi:hypothetical protein
MKNKLKKILNGSGRDVVEVLSWNFPGGNEKTVRNLSQNSWCLGRDSNPAPLEHESRATPISHPVRFSTFKQVFFYMRHFIRYAFY